MTTPFTADDVDRASTAWNANCGPCAIAAICGLTLDDTRPHLGVDWPGYTNPTRMAIALNSVGIPWQLQIAPNWPRYGLCRIQWEGPWTKAGVHPRAAYRYTHWVGASSDAKGVGIYDVNAMRRTEDGSGWLSLENWAHLIVPEILADYPRASGMWRIATAIEVERR